MAIVAEILLADRALPLVDLACSIPSNEISISNIVPLEDERLLVAVTMTDDSREAFEREADAQPEVVDVVEIGRTAKGWFYRLTIDDESGLAASHDHESFKGVLMNASVTPEGVRHQKVFSDYEAFKTHRDLCAAQNIPFKLLTIAADPENPGERDQFGLTEKQHQAISVAFARGYYDSPRTLTTKELATELGISGPSASDLLRRAENQLISQTLGPEESVSQHTQ